MAAQYGFLDASKSKLHWTTSSSIAGSGFKNPSTGRRAYRRQAREGWELMQSEDLRIIADGLWAALQHRLRTRRRLFARAFSDRARPFRPSVFRDMRSAP